MKPELLNEEVITPVFKDRKNSDYKMIGFLAKKARGRMAAWIIRNRVKDPGQLVRFDEDGYRYSESLSSPGNPVFLRREK